MARLRGYLQAETTALLRAEFDAVRAEMQADRQAFQETIEKLHQINNDNLAAHAEQLAQMRKLFVELDVARLVESFDAALTTITLHPRALGGQEQGAED